LAKAAFETNIHSLEFLRRSTFAIESQPKKEVLRVISPLWSGFKSFILFNRLLHAKADQEMRVCWGSGIGRKWRNEEILPVNAK
jgi:hypothetical protein